MRYLSAFLASTPATSNSGHSYPDQPAKPTEPPSMVCAVSKDSCQEEPTKPAERPRGPAAICLDTYSKEPTKPSELDPTVTDGSFVGSVGGSPQVSISSTPDGDFRSAEALRSFQPSLDSPSPSSWPPRDPRLAKWPLKRRRRWGVRANALEDAGLDWREAEQQAFQELLAEPPQPTTPTAPARSTGGGPAVAGVFNVTIYNGDQLRPGSHHRGSPLVL